MTAKKSLVFILAGLLTLISCEDSSPNATPAPSTSSVTHPYFPTDPLLNWYYNDATTAVFFEEIKNISGYATSPLKHPNGAAEYFYTTSTDVFHLGVFVPDIQLDNSTYTADVSFDEAVILFSTNWEVGYSYSFLGYGVVNISPQYGLSNINYIGTVNYQREEIVSVPFGEFAAKRIRFRMHLSAMVGGEEIIIPLNTTLWLVEDVGIVKRIDKGATYELSAVEEVADTESETVNGGP